MSDKCGPSPTFTRRAFTCTVFGGSGLAAAGWANPILALGSSVSPVGATADIHVWTSWTEPAIRVLKAALLSTRRLPVPTSEPAVPDHVVKREVTALASADRGVAGCPIAPPVTEYYVAMSREADPFRAEEQAADVVHSLSVWRIDRSGCSDDRATVSVENGYSRSVQGPTRIRDAIRRASAPLRTAQLNGLRRYYHLTV